MRVHRLSLQAFGPYAGQEVVDFDALSAHGLHLIHGATGAGKTSILDAICFALYGRIPGARTGQRETLVSDHASPGVRPEVVLEFTVSGRRLRIERSPEHTAAKKRGTGTTTRQAKVLLEERRDGRWHVLGTRLDEVGALITDLLGMQIDQFAQVVLLPQGEFAHFLRARPEERSEVLRRLFDISRFSDAEAYLIDRRKVLRAAVDDSQGQLRSHLARAEEAMSEIEVDLGHDVWLEAPAGELPALVEEAVRTLNVQVTQAMAESDAASQAVDQAHGAQAAGITTARLQAQTQEAAGVVAAFADAADDRRARVERLDAARRAELIAPHRAAGERRQRAVDTAATAVRRAVETAAEHLPGVGVDGLGDAVSRPVIDDLLDRLRLGERALQAAGSLADRVELLAQRLATHRRNAAGAQAQLTACVERRDALVAEIAEVASTLEQRVSCAATTPRAQRALELVETAAQAVADGDRWLTLREAATDAARIAASHYATLEQRVITLRTHRLSGIAAELGAQLAEGAPCAVCGSTDHPHPAQPSADSVTAEDIATAETAARDAADALTEHRQEIARATAHQEAALAVRGSALHALGDAAREPDEVPMHDADDAALPELLEQRMRRARVELREGQQAQADVDRIRSEQVARKGALADTEDLVRAARDASAAAQAAASTTSDDLAESQDRLSAVLGEHSRCCACPNDPDAERLPTGLEGCAEALVAQARARLETHEIHQRAVEALAAAGLTLDAAERELKRAEDELSSALARQGFDTLSQAGDAELAPAEREVLQSALDVEQEAHAKARGVLEMPDAQAAAARPTPDLAALAEAVTQAKHLARQLQGRAAAAERAHRSLENLHTRVNATLRDSASDRRELEVLDPLTDSVIGAGDNLLRMRLTSYVLAARLEAVTALANEKLHVMTGGRYRLEHTDDLARGGMRSGLGLRVRDAWTGKSRDTATLSGGESFMASLALALGLGDAVLHDAGGRELQTLFVDEGFGSLDEESLEQVMEVLDALRAGGRAVGIVSHVRELQDRIPAQILVHKTAQGSTIDVVSPMDQVA
ncbi:AAA family ATPase [Leekyejoonella antrihumi]|uniref:Nuclease SbcCD subunit C n=1 Tax=Leekyejoonella antrihumi TaxID=1660198 RepID=A0A563E3C4_9MICO|nr:SMC family ATPase [Leekyejoonella antrihumi]TWP36809.1 SMC family ATPase [Leekyejoonella antrihumi]